MSTTALHDSKLPDMAHKATVTPTSSSPATQQPSSKSSTPVKPTDPSTLPNPDVPAMLSQFDDERSGQAVNSQAESSHRPDAPLPAKASDMSSRQPLDSVVQAQPPPAPITESDRIIESTAPPEVDMSRAVVSHAIRSKRRPGRMLVLWLGLLVVLIVAADVMLDSGAVKPSFQLPHTHFLRNP